MKLAHTVHARSGTEDIVKVEELEERVLEMWVDKILVPCRNAIHRQVFDP